MTAEPRWNGELPSAETVAESFTNEGEPVSTEGLRYEREPTEGIALRAGLDYRWCNFHTDGHVTVEERHWEPVPPSCKEEHSVLWWLEQML